MQERERIQAEAKRREEELIRAETERKENFQRNQEQIKKSVAKRPAMSDSKFVELCKSGDAARVEEVIIDGANVNAKDYDGETALMWAASKGRTETAELLIKHGANVNAKTNRGWTALRWAANEDIANLLRKYGARE